MSDNYIYLSTRNDFYDYSLAVYNEDGVEQREAINVESSIEANQTPNSVYTRYGSTLQKYDKSGDSLNSQWSTEDANVNGYMSFAENEDPILSAYFGPIVRYDKTDGSEVWNVSFPQDYKSNDITRLSNGNVAIALADEDTSDHLIREYDITSGAVANEISHKSDQQPVTGVARDLNDNYVVSSNSSNVTKYDRQSGDVIWQASVSFNDVDRIYWDGESYYVYKLSNVNEGQIEKLSNTGSSEWSKTFDFNDAQPRPYNGGTAIVHNWAENCSLIDAGDGSEIWSKNLGYPYETVESVSAYPPASAFPVEWGIKIEISGTVVDGGTGVSGAKVTVIDDTSDEVLTTTTTDSNGNWSATVPDTRLHVVAQYEDDSGTVYNTTSYPYVNSQ